MVLKVLGSSSSGNSYILDDGNEALIIEAGIKLLDVKKLWDGTSVEWWAALSLTSITITANT